MITYEAYMKKATKLAEAAQLLDKVIAQTIADIKQNDDFKGIAADINLLEKACRNACNRRFINE